jgi:subtilase family serine protease
MPAHKVLTTSALSVAAVSTLLLSGVSSAATVTPGHSNRALVPSTAPLAGQNAGLRAMPLTSRVHVSVFIGRDQAGLAAAAVAISNPRSPRYEHYLSPAQVQGAFGATAAQQRAVGTWLARSGLAVTHRDPFVVSATGTAAQAEAAVRATLEQTRPRGGVAQVVSSTAMSVPASLGSAVSTIRMSPANIPMGHHEALKASDTAAPGSKAAFTVKQECSVYYGQKKASTLPAAFGKTLSFAPCGYLPQQLRSAYGATRSGLTGRGVSVAILSEDNDSTALSDANRWAKDRHFPPFKPGQFLANVASHGVPNGVGDIESALDVESVHGMAPDARVNYVVGNGTITGDRLLDALDTVVTYRIATAVSSSWFEGYMPVPKSMITAWEGVLQRATVEGIGVNFATGDFGDETPLQYPGSDPWITLVGGTSLAVGKHGNALWEAGWESDQAGLSKNGQSWKPAPPGVFSEGSTGGVSKTFPEPFYQQGVASHNIRNGVAMRVVPDISDLGDWNLGYQIGVSIPIGRHKVQYFNQMNGGTSLSSPMFTGFEADVIQGRGGISLGFANPALYNYANTPTFNDITGNPQGQGVTEATVFGIGYGQPPTLSVMGQCGDTHHLACGVGYDTVSGLGSPGRAFFKSFGSKPK